MMPTRRSSSRTGSARWLVSSKRFTASINGAFGPIFAIDVLITSETFMPASPQSTAHYRLCRLTGRSLQRRWRRSDHVRRSATCFDRFRQCMSMSRHDRLPNLLDVRLGLEGDVTSLLLVNGTQQGVLITPDLLQGLV